MSSQRRFTEGLRLSDSKRQELKPEEEELWLTEDETLKTLYPSVWDELEVCKEKIRQTNLIRKVMFKGNKLRYNAVDITKYIAKQNRIKVRKTPQSKQKEYFTEASADKKDSRNNEYLSISSYFNKLSLLKGHRVESIDFYGEDVETYRPYESYRMIYGLTMFHRLIDDTFMDMKGLHFVYFEALLFLGNMRYFSYKDLYHFSHSALRRGDSYLSFKKKLEELGWIEVAKIPRSKDNKRLQNTQFRITSKASDLFKEYVDYLMFRKKLPMIYPLAPNAKNGAYDIKNLKVHPEKKYFRHHAKHKRYAFYSYMYEYINTVEQRNPLGIDEKEVDLAIKEGASDYKFSAMFYLTAQVLYRKGKVTRRMLKVVENFLSKDIYQDTGIEYKYNKKAQKRTKTTEADEQEKYGITLEEIAQRPAEKDIYKNSKKWFSKFRTKEELAELEKKKKQSK